MRWRDVEEVEVEIGKSRVSKKSNRMIVSL